MHHDSATSKEVGTPAETEIEVTPEMIEAGQVCCVRFDLSFLLTWTLNLLQLWREMFPSQFIDRRRTMRPSQFTEEQIIGMLKEQEAGARR